MDCYTHYRKPFVIKYGGMAYRGRGHSYPKVNMPDSPQSWDEGNGVVASAAGLRATYWD